MATQNMSPMFGSDADIARATILRARIIKALPKQVNVASVMMNAEKAAMMQTALVTLIPQLRRKGNARWWLENERRLMSLSFATLTND